MLEHALALVARGFAIFPVHGVNDGKCTCEKAACASAGKHPIPTDGFYSATRDADAVRAWWDAFPGANIGIRTGDGLLVVDVDPRNGGDATYEQLEREYGELPETFAVLTGSGGMHAFLRVDGARHWKKAIGDGVDIKSDGGYVVGVGSRHASGGTYTVLQNAPIAPAPEWLIELASARAGAPSSAPRPTASAIAVPLPTEPIDLGALRERLAEVRRSKAHGTPDNKEQAAVLGRVLDGEPLAKVGFLHPTRVRLCGLLGAWLPAGTPWESVLELLRPCLLASPLDVGNTIEAAIEKTRKLYEDSMRGRIEREATRAEQIARLREVVAKVAGKKPAAVAEELGDKWPELLIVDGKGVKPCEHNVDVILACAPEFKNTVRWNDVTKRLEMTGGPFVDVNVSSVAGKVAAHLQRNHACMASENLVGKALLRVARETPYDPIAEYLNELVWDRQPRLDTFLERYFGAKAASEEYLRAVSRRWPISLVARALEPGCKVDDVLVLEGPQGAGKSRGLEAIVGRQHFVDTALALGDKDTMQLIASAWLVELGELASLRRAESEKVKQFLSSRVDKFRPPYGAVIEESPRRCVFAGTTNEESYLVDPTGNRRYWPVRVGVIDVEGIERDRNLVLAEAVIAYRAGERWWLAPDEMRLAAIETDSRMNVSTVKEAIAKWWYGTEPAKRPRRVTMLDVSDLALHLTIDRVDRGVTTEIGHAMRQIGFVNRRESSGARTRFYEPTDELLSAPRVQGAADARILALVKPTVQPAASPSNPTP